MSNNDQPYEQWPGNQIYIKDLMLDEIRDGFFVSLQQKRLWNVQINLIVEFARICRKHDIRWFAYAGTLLGAARHGGFIPWDDDVDLCMLRPDYEKFVAVVESELRPEFFFDAWYNYSWEGEPNAENLPIISLDHLKRYRGWWPAGAHSKLRDSRTMMIEFPDRPNVNQGIWIDIFPLDPAPPFVDKLHDDNFQMVTQLMLVANNPQYIVRALEHGDNLIEPAWMADLVNQPYKQRAIAYERYLADHFFESEYISHIKSIFAYNRSYDWKLECFRDIVELPFEMITLPAPIGYDDILKVHFGDWRTPVKADAIHTSDYSPDISYKDYFAKSNRTIK